MTRVGPSWVIMTRVWPSWMIMTSLTTLSDYDKSLTTMSDYAKSWTLLSDYDKSWTLLSDYDKSLTILSDYDKSLTILRGPCEVDRMLKSGYCFILWLLSPCLVGAFKEFSLSLSLIASLNSIHPLGKFGLRDLGEATSATRATLHVPASACSIIMCPNNGIAASVLGWPEIKNPVTH